MLLACSFIFAEEEYKDTGTGRIRIGFTQFKNKANAIQSRGYGRGYGEFKFDLEAFTEMLQTALVKTRRFEVIERTDLDQILSEQGLASTGIVNEDTGAITGKIRGVDFLLIGTVTKCGFTKKPIQVGNFKQEKTIIELGIDFRLTDVNTGRIVLSDFVEVNDESQSSVSGNNYSSSTSSENYIANVMRKASLQAGFLIANAIEPVKVEAVQASKKLVKINYGNGFIEKDQFYRIFPNEEDDLGDDWGAGFDEVAKVKIKVVTQTYAIADVIEGDVDNISVGYSCQKVSPDEEKKYKDLEKLKERDSLGNRFGY